MGSNEKGMRHDNAKILGFGLLALAAVLALKDKKSTPKVGGVNFDIVSNEREDVHKRAKAALEALSYYYGKSIREAKTTESEYLKIRQHNRFIEVRASDHKKGKRKMIEAQIDLWKMAHNRTAQQTYSEARKYIDMILS